MITVKNLSYAIDKKAILKNVSVEIEPGGITALIGPNGAGKSTLLHCISSLLVPQTGTVGIAGLDPFSAPSNERAKHIALLQQSPKIVNRLRVRELVSFGRWPHHQGRPSSKDIDLIDDAMDAFDLSDLADRPLDALSGGQRQRAFVAMAYAQDTPWLLLDEPLNALDPKHARDLMARLQHLAKAKGKSIIVVLHDINAAAQWADRIVALKDGKIAAHDKSVDLLKPDTLEEIFDTKFDVLMHKGKAVVLTH